MERENDFEDDKSPQHPFKNNKYEQKLFNDDYKDKIDIANKQKKGNPFHTGLPKVCINSTLIRWKKG